MSLSYANYIPKEGYLLVREDEPEKETEGGIMLPDSVSEDAGAIKTATVARGSGEHAGLVGETVMYMGWCANPFPLKDDKGNELKMIHIRDILGATAFLGGDK